MNLSIEKVLICSVTPYFLERGSLWFQENLSKIIAARKTQSFFEDNTILLEKNQKRGLSQLLRELDELGYEKVISVSEQGEFSQKGGVIEVFPLNLNRAIRLDFLGNKLEEIETLPVEVSDEDKSREILKKKLKSQKLFSDLKGLKPGDYLVHLDHGVGRFSGINKIVHDRELLKYYVLEYAQGDKLYVPVGLERKLSRYVGFIGPRISRLGSPFWERTKRKVKEDAEKLAKELLELYAKRETSQRPPYLPDDEIDKMIALSFAYQETPDQIQAMEDIKQDLESLEPMDRIVCGDVGFGKTELALRTMVKAVKSNWQAAMLCPTTVLAYQHFQNFRERLKDLPVKVALLSRLQDKKGQQEIIEDLKQGRTDIVVATHRLLSEDVQFKNLGLLVVDDEQRFGVKQKEKLKKLRSSLDVLSLSATPIPRTLYLALSSLKNISLIQTAPEGRQPVKTSILPFNKEIIKKAVEDEVARGGQVYYLHNRVETIEAVKKNLETQFPKIKTGLAHSRLKEKKLINTMTDFQNKKTDVLVATTIIENGLDLANVNTLIVTDSAKLGLAQAYQIRGRIGRSNIPAFAYFLHGKRLSGKAKERLKALKEAEELGSGYRIAIKDLEIRGAGNILGKEQSGNVNKVGLNLYCQMLSEAIERLRK